MSTHRISRSAIDRAIEAAGPAKDEVRAILFGDAGIPVPQPLPPPGTPMGTFHYLPQEPLDER